MDLLRTTVPFPTRDATQVELHAVEDRLEVRFLSGAAPVLLVFTPCAGLRWNALEGEAERDGLWMVPDSPWLDALASSSEEAAAGLQHFRLCLGAAGILDVIARQLDVG